MIIDEKKIYQRMAGLDLFRVVAAVMVLLFHIHIHHDCSFGALTGFVSMGAIFMTGFFMLSGFVLFRTYQEQSLVQMDSLKKIENELRAMGQIVSGYLNFAERKAERREPMTMADWSKHLDMILTAGGEKLLRGNGSVSHEQAVNKATDEYRKYQQKTLSSVEQAFLDSIKAIEKKSLKK